MGFEFSKVKRDKVLAKMRKVAKDLDSTPTELYRRQQRSDTMAKKTKKTAKKSTKKTAVKATKKKAVPSKNGQHEIRWSDKKITLLRTLRKAKATSALAGITKGKIVSRSKGEALSDLNPNFDITVQGYIGQAQIEDQRARVYYITKKGVKVLEKHSK